MESVLVSYGWNRIAYAITRSLGSRGVPVFVADASSISMAGLSRFARRKMLCPSPYGNPEAFVRGIVRLLNKTEARIYMPAHEETLLSARFRELFPPHVIIPVPEFSALKLAHMKGRLLAQAECLGIPIPRTVRVESLDQLPSLVRTIPYPSVIKLNQSNSAKGVFYVDTPDALLAKYPQVIQDFGVAAKDYPLIQEYVHGEGWGVSLLYNKGQLRAKFVHRRLVEKTHTGGTSTRRVSAVNAPLEGAAQRLLDHLQWHGVAMVEFKYDPCSGRFWLMEVNPRFWGSLALAVAAGVDFPWLLYRMATEGDVAPVLQYRTGVCATWLLGDMLAMVDHLRHGKARILRSLMTTRSHVYDDFWLDDPIPFLGQAAYYLSKFLRTASTNPVDEAMLVLDDERVPL